MGRGFQTRMTIILGPGPNLTQWVILEPAGRFQLAVKTPLLPPDAEASAGPPPHDPPPDAQAAV